ncbi:MAG: discoidin domain-containing protein [Methylococcales bacterium]|nr:discoidin domain-containing protein [Methylococcales bacterium]
MKKILYALGVLLLAVAAVFFMRSYWEKETIALIDQYYQHNKPAAGNVYYVSPSGSDNNNGTSLTSPIRTITNALSKARISGDTIYVMTGTYSETVSITQSGITLSAYLGNKPVIDGGTTLPSGDWGVLLSINGNYNTISGFEVSNSNITGKFLAGTGIESNGHHNRISKMNVHHTWGSGIQIHGDYNIVEDSIAWQNSLSNSINSGSATWGSGITAARGSSSSSIPHITSYPTLRRNKVFNNWGEGLSCFETDHCILEDNIVYDNWTINFYLSDATNSLVQRNFIYVSPVPAISTRFNGHPPVMLADEVSSAPRSTNNIIINNIIYNTDVAVFSWTGVLNSGLKNSLIANNTIVEGSISIGSGGSLAIVNTNSQIINNIITGRNSSVPSNKGITFSYNNWALTPSLAASPTNINADPQLTKTGSTTPGNLLPDYFKLLPSSPLIGAGLGIPQVTDDFFKSPRTGSVTDIGAYQLQTPGVDSTAPSTPTNLTAYATSSTQVNLAWSASTDNVGVTGYKIYRNGSQIGTSTVASLVDTVATGGTNYNYTVIAFDLAGNASAVTNTAYVTTPAAIVPVSITSNNAGSITTTSAQINWTTNTPSTGVVSYGTSATNLNATANINNLSTTQSVQINGLTSGTLYYYKITAGNSTVASSFNTQPTAVIQPPSVSVNNIAKLASVTASSQNTSTNQQAIKAIDGIVKSWPDNTHEWATNGQKTGAWIELKWNALYTINKIVLYDRPNTNDQITSAILTFSNGSTVKVGSLINSGDAVIINFPSVVTNTVKLTVTTVSATTANIGLDEIEVFGFISTPAESKAPTNIAKLSSVTASSQNTSTNQQAIKAIDGIVKSWPDNTHEWATNGQKTGAWIDLKWNAPYTINKIVLYDRPNKYDQITSATLTFSNGSTVKVGSLINSGDAVVINFPSVVTNSVKLTVNSVNPTTANIGLDEIEVFGF